MKKQVIILLAIVLQTAYISARESSSSPWVPDQVSVQFAGNIGLISVGTGYKFLNETWQTDVLVGYVPKSISEKEIYTVAWKNTFKIVRFPIKQTELSFHGAFSVNMETGNNSDLNPNNHYPDGYYGTDSFTAGLFLGTKYKVPLKSSKLIESVSFGVEVCTLASYLYYNWEAEDERYKDIYSISFHTNLNF